MFGDYTKNTKDGRYHAATKKGNNVSRNINIVILII